MEQDRTSSHFPAPGHLDWRPPAARLPGRHGHIELWPDEFLGSDGHRYIWRGASERPGGGRLVIEFLRVCPNEEPVADSSGRRVPRPGRSCRGRLATGGPGYAVALSVTGTLRPRSSGGFHRAGGDGASVDGGVAGVSRDLAGGQTVRPSRPDGLAAGTTFDPDRPHPFLEEARAGITINHPCIARTYQLLDLRSESAVLWPPPGSPCRGWNLPWPGCWRTCGLGGSVCLKIWRATSPGICARLWRHCTGNIGWSIATSNRVTCCSTSRRARANIPPHQGSIMAFRR